MNMRTTLQYPLSILFILMMSWHVSYNFKIIIALPMFALIAVSLYNPFPLREKSLRLVLSFIALFIFWALLNILIYEDVNFTETSLFIRKAITGIVIMIFVLYFYAPRIELLKRSIDYVLIIILTIWVIQLVGYYVTGEYLDILKAVPGSLHEQRYEAYFISAILPIDFIRPTSIYVEPGTYAVNTFPLLVLSYINHKKLTLLHKIILFSYFISLSFFAIIIATLFLLTLYISEFEFRLSKKNIVFVFIFMIVTFSVIQYINLRFFESGGTEQLGYREIVLNYWFSLSSQDLLVGLGAGQTAFDNYSDPILLEDATFLVKLLFEYGIFAIPYFVLMMYISKGKTIFFFFIILLTKLHYQIYILWFYPAALYLLLAKDQVSQIRGK